MNEWLRCWPELVAAGLVVVGLSTLLTISACMRSAQISEGERNKGSGN